MARWHLSLAAVALLMAPSGAEAGALSDAVRAFYDRPGSETEPEMRDRFAEPVRKLFAQDEALRRSGETEGCLDQGLSGGGKTPVAAETKRTLKLAEREGDETSIVLASFTISGEPRKIEWVFRKEDGEWKIADIRSLTDEWALSQFNCE